MRDLVRTRTRAPGALVRMRTRAPGALVRTRTHVQINNFTFSSSLTRTPLIIKPQFSVCTH